MRKHHEQTTTTMARKVNEETKRERIVVCIQAKIECVLRQWRWRWIVDCDDDRIVVGEKVHTHQRACKNELKSTKSEKKQRYTKQKYSVSINKTPQMLLCKVKATKTLRSLSYFSNLFGSIQSLSDSSNMKFLQRFCCQCEMSTFDANPPVVSVLFCCQNKFAASNETRLSPVNRSFGIDWRMAFTNVWIESEN